MVMPKSAEEHLLQHDSILQGGRKMIRVLSMIWIATVGALWVVRNDMIFRGKEVDVVRITDEVQYKVWLWLKSKGEEVQCFNL